LFNKVVSDGDIINNALDYLSCILLLSKCGYLVAGRTSGTVGAYIFSSGYKDEFLFNLGLYGYDDAESLWHTDHPL
jgi:hypothetical protein